MLNAATRSATAANTSRTVSKKPMKASSTSARCSAVSCRAGDRSDPGGQGRLQLAHQLGLADARLGPTTMLVTCPGGRRCSAVSNVKKVVPADAVHVPNVAMPTTVTFTGRGTTRSWCAHVEVTGVAAPRLITTSSVRGARAPRPSDGLSAVVDPVLAARASAVRCRRCVAVGAPICTSPSTTARSSRHRRAAATSSSTDAGIAPRWVSPSAVMRCSLRTARRCPRSRR